MKIDTDKILGAGLIVVLLVKIIGDIAVTLLVGSPPNHEFASNLASGLVGFMGRDLALKMRKDERNDNQKPKTADKNGDSASQTNSR